MVLFSWDLDNRGILVSLEEILNAKDLRNLAFGVDWKRDGGQILKLNFQTTLNDIVLSHWGNLDSNLDLSALFLSNFEPDFFEILKSLVAPHRKDILIKIIKFYIVTFGDHPKHVRVRAIVFDDFVLETDRDIKFLDRSWE